MLFRSAPSRSANARVRRLPYGVAARVPTIATHGFARPESVPHRHKPAAVSSTPRAPHAERIASRDSNTGSSIIAAITQIGVARKGYPFRACSCLDASLEGTRRQAREWARHQTEVPQVAAEAYCVKCKTKRQIKDAVQITMKNGRPATEGKCPECGTKMFKIGAAS